MTSAGLVIICLSRRRRTTWERERSGNEVEKCKWETRRMEVGNKEMAREIVVLRVQAVDKVP